MSYICDGVGRQSQELHSLLPSCTKKQGQIRDQSLKPTAANSSLTTAEATKASVNLQVGFRLLPFSSGSFPTTLPREGAEHHGLKEPLSGLVPLALVAPSSMKIGTAKEVVLNRT